MIFKLNKSGYCIMDLESIFKKYNKGGIIMDKYRGKYRVVCEFDRNTLEPIKDDTYIQCSKNAQIYRVNNYTLAYYRPTRGNSNQFTDTLIDLGVKGCENRSSDGDILIYFKEEYLDIVTKKVGVIESGLNIPPSSVKNLRKLDWFKKNKDYYIKNGIYEESSRELSDEELEILRERFKKNLNR